jgi:hypothetical protein
MVDEDRHSLGAGELEREDLDSRQAALDARGHLAVQAPLLVIEIRQLRPLKKNGRGAPISNCVKCGESRIARRYFSGVRAPAAVLWLFLVLTAGGCGSGEMGAGEGEQATEPMTTAPDVGEGDITSRSQVGWSMMAASGLRPTGPPTASKLAVFHEPAKPSDSFGSSDSENSWDFEGTPEKFQPGHEQFARARLLVPAAYGDGLSFFGVPTDKGWVCLHLVEEDDPEESVGGTCSRDLTGGIDYLMGGTQESFEVYGLIADDVRRVDVVANGTSWPAVVGRNAFIFQAHPQKICPTEIESLILERAKGQRDEIEVYSPGPEEADRMDDSSFGCR